MSSVGWTILLVGLGLAADVAWTEYREWKRRTTPPEERRLEGTNGPARV